MVVCILPVQVVRGIGISRSVQSRDDLGEGSDRHLGRGRSEASGESWLPRNQNPRIL